ALAACDDPAPRQRGEGGALPTPGRPAEAQRIVEERLRARLRVDGELRLRALQAYRQATPDTLALCGQVNPGARNDTPFIPFVAAVSFEGERATRVEFHLGATSAEATRVYYEMLDRCFDGGGTPRRGGVGALPPAPEPLPAEPMAEARPPAPSLQETIATPQPQQFQAQPLPLPQVTAPVTATTRPAGGTAVTRGPANLRDQPSGAGSVLRVIPRGATLQVFAEAPGGWLQLGEEEPWGWVHASLLEPR
ncbi:SH3 domain-containing protein, partial [Falsiroseomonas oryziterrae]|uniref:SH3 domain-containing protein n=1 Tax=Falsiroseomonas oryziterrae TaxID=2911368 RepID=UPI001F20D942